jgi:hypothetical protein
LGIIGFDKDGWPLIAVVEKKVVIKSKGDKEKRRGEAINMVQWWTEVWAGTEMEGSLTKIFAFSAPLSECFQFVRRFLALKFQTDEAFWGG